MFHFEVGATTRHISCFKVPFSINSSPGSRKAEMCNQPTNQPTRLHFNGLSQGTSIYTHWLNTPKTGVFVDVFSFSLWGYFQLPAFAFMGCMFGRFVRVEKQSMVESQKKNPISISCQTCGKKSATLVRKAFITPNPPLLNLIISTPCKSKR